jgi:hypothetical protein
MHAQLLISGFPLGGEHRKLAAPARFDANDPKLPPVPIALLGVRSQWPRRRVEPPQ